jgi:hypothetical protein
MEVDKMKNYPKEGDLLYFNEEEFRYIDKHIGIDFLHPNMPHFVRTESGNEYRCILLPSKCNDLKNAFIVFRD